MQELQACSAVGQAGQLVDGARAAQQLRRAALLADVGAGQQPEPAVVVQRRRRDGQLAPHGRPVAAQQRHGLHLVAVCRAGRHRAQPAGQRRVQRSLQRSRARIGDGVGAQGGDRDPAQLLGDDVEQRAQGRVDLADDAVRIDDGDARGNQRGEVGEPAGGVPGAGLELVLPRDVPDHPDQPGRSAVGPELHLGTAAEPGPRQHELGLVVTQAGTGAQRPDQQRDLLALDGAAAAVRLDPPLAVDLLERRAAVQRSRGQLVAPGPDAGHALQLGGEAALAAVVGPGDEDDDLQLLVGDVPLQQVHRDRGVVPQDERLRARADDERGERRAEELGLRAAGEPLQRRVHLNDPVRAVAHEGGGRGGERELDALTQRRAGHGPGGIEAGGIEPGRFEEVAAESGPAQSARDGGRRLRGRRRGALDDSQRGLAGAGHQTESPGPGRGPRTRPRRTGGGQFDGRLVALAGEGGERRGPRRRGCGGRLRAADGRRNAGGRDAVGVRPGGRRGARTGRKAGRGRTGRGVGDDPRQPGGEQSGVGVRLGAVARLLGTLQVHPRHRVHRLRPRPARALRVGAIRVGSVHVRAAVLGHGHLPGWWCRPSLVQRANGRHDPPDSPDRPTPHRGHRPRSVTTRSVRPRHGKRSGPIGRTGRTAPAPVRARRWLPPRLPRRPRGPPGDRTDSARCGVGRGRRRPRRRSRRRPRASSSR